MLKKIQIKEIIPNKYRGIKQYPIDQEKVNYLKESFKKTGMWIGIVGRKAENNKIEIAFGHHRKEAAKQLGYKEIDVDVRKISDADMIRMMADENMDRKINSAVINQTVMSAKQFLEKAISDPIKSEFDWLFERKEDKTKAINKGVGEQHLMKFLGKEWQRNINIALRTINDKKIVAEAVEVFEKPAHADKTRAMLKKHNVPVEKQKEVTEKIKKKVEKAPAAKHEKAEVTSQKIEDAFNDEFFGKTYKQEREKKRPDINSMLDEYAEKLKEINFSLDEVLENIEYANNNSIYNFTHQVKELLNKINIGAKQCKQLKLIK